MLGYYTVGYLCVFGPTVGSGGLGFRTVLGALQHGSLHVLKKCFLCIYFILPFVLQNLILSTNYI